MFFGFSRLIVDKDKSVLEGDFCCGHRLKALPYDRALRFSASTDSEKSHLTKLLRTEKREKYEKFLVRRTKQGFVPCKDNKPKRSGFFLFSGVLSLSTISQRLSVIIFGNLIYFFKAIGSYAL